MADARGADRGEEDVTSDAESLYLDYLARNLRGEAIDFARLCEEHPREADRLRALHAGQAALGEVRERARVGDDPRSAALKAMLDELEGRRSFAGRYTRERTIGSGGQGEVQLAREKALRRSVAIKTLRADLFGRRDGEDPTVAEQMLARFLAEAQITAQLDHPGVAAVHELGVDDEGHPYFTMDRVEGIELAEVFRLHRAGSPEWPRVRCVGLLLRVCETMAFAHSRSVVHRDLKPANVMVGTFGEVLVMDWGLARALGSEDRTADRAPGKVSTVRDAPPVASEHRSESSDRSDSSGRSGRSGRTRPTDRTGPTDGAPAARAARADRARDLLLDTLPRENLGTVFYTAPEVAGRGTGAAGPPADVYATGAMLYELLSGRPPYWVEGGEVDLGGILERIQAEPPADLREATLRSDPTSAPPEALVAICERAMARAPEERYANMSALAADLRAFLEERVVRAHTSGPWAELRMWVRRNRALAAALGAVLLLVAAGSLTIAGLESRARQRLDLEADLYRLPYLERRADELWPEDPDHVPALRQWLRTGEALAARADVHAARLAALPAEGGAAAELERDALAGIVGGIDRFRRDDGLLHQVRRRLEWAESVERVTLEEPSAAWSEAREAAGDAAGPYGGLALEPVLGLIPLGTDPATGLLEFGHPRSGRVPTRGPDGLEVDESTGLVFVLVPGGGAELGAQRDDPAAACHDPAARPEEAPVRSVELAPFLVSKFEMTQGQWERLSGETPSFVRSDEAEGGADAAHPVEGVSFDECLAWLPRFSMALPTEDQWEYAARAGTLHPFLEHARPEQAAVPAAFNLADASVRRAGLDWPQARGMEWLDDGFVRHAPVGLLRSEPVRFARRHRQRLGVVPHSRR